MQPYSTLRNQLLKHIQGKMSYIVSYSNLLLKTMQAQWGLVNSEILVILQLHGCAFV